MYIIPLGTPPRPCILSVYTFTSPYLASHMPCSQHIFLSTQMEERSVREREEEEQKVKDAELARIAELEKPAPDDLYGMRVHCWVLVLAGRREVINLLS